MPGGAILSALQHTSASQIILVVTLVVASGRLFLPHLLRFRQHHPTPLLPLWDNSALTDTNQLPVLKGRVKWVYGKLELRQC